MAGAHAIKLADGLTMSMEAVTQKFAFMGRSGSGKTYGAIKLAEQLYINKAQIVALDPVGVWYGLRIGADGKQRGFPINVFGGLHGDVPIRATDGELIADVIVDRNISAIIDTSQFESSADQSRFVAAFAKRLFFRKKATPSALMLFVEECQEFIPEQPAREQNMVLHEMRRLGKIGRNYGIGVCLVSQRPQAVDKEVLNMTEVMVTLQMTGPHERETIKKWVSQKGGDIDIVDILPRLEVGQAHVWSPQWLGVSKTVKISKRETFNASSTPVFGSAPKAEPKPLDAADLTALRDSMAATIEEAEANDPDKLRDKIFKLEYDLGELRAKSIFDPMEDPAIQAERDGWEDERIKWAEVIQYNKDKLRDIVVKLSEIRDWIDAVTENVNRIIGEDNPEPRATAARASMPAPAKTELPRTPRERLAPRALDGRTPATAPTGEMSKMRRAFLTALAQHPSGLSKALILLHADYRSSGSTSTEFSDLTKLGWMTSDGTRCYITDAGLTALGSYQRLPVGRERLKLLVASDKLAMFERKVLSVLGANPSTSYTKNDLLAACGYKSSGSTSTGFARLAKFGYMEKDGAKVRLSKNLR